MRSLASGIYTAAQVEAALRASTAQFTRRFEVLAPNLSVTGTLGRVTSATVSCNTDDAIKGSLALTLLADAATRTLLGSHFASRIKPWLGITMPDGGRVEWPLGVYLWHGVPDRIIDGVGTDTWSITMGDLGHLLDMSGPGAAGWVIAAGTNVADALRTIYAAAGFSDLSGISTTTATIAVAQAYDVTDASGQPTRWRTIVQPLHEAAGFYSPWFDGNGRVMATPQPNLATSSASVTYRTDARSITLASSTTASGQPDRLCNRVIGRATLGNGSLFTATSDANTLLPTHPLRQGAIGFYVDAVLESSSVSSAAELQAACDAYLTRRLAAYDTVQLPTRAYPLHEAFDLVGVQYASDAKLNTEVLYHERAWSIDMFSYRMLHQLRRVG